MGFEFEDQRPGVLATEWTRIVQTCWMALSRRGRRSMLSVGVARHGWSQAARVWRLEMAVRLSTMTGVR